MRASSLHATTSFTNVNMKIYAKMLTEKCQRNAIPVGANDSAQKC